MKMMDKMKTIIAAILTSLPFSSQAQSLGLTCWTIEGGQTKLAVENSFMEVPDSIAAIIGFLKHFSGCNEWHGQNLPLSYDARGL